MFRKGGKSATPPTTPRNARLRNPKSAMCSKAIVMAECALVCATMQDGAPKEEGDTWALYGPQCKRAPPFTPWCKRRHLQGACTRALTHKAGLCVPALLDCFAQGKQTRAGTHEAHDTRT